MKNFKFICQMTALSVMSLFILESCTSSKNAETSGVMPKKEYKIVHDDNGTFSIMPEDGEYKIYSDEGLDLFVKIENGNVEGVYKNGRESKNKVNIKVYFTPCDNGGLAASYNILKINQRSYVYKGNSTCFKTDDKNEKFYIAMFANNPKDAWYTMKEE